MALLARMLLVGAAYLAFARYSGLLHAASGLGAVFWPGAGVTVAALLVSPRRWWPALLATVGAVEFGNDLAAGSGVVASTLWGLANVLEPLLAAWLVQRWRADRFEDVGGVVRFAAAAFVAPVLGGAVGALGTLAFAADVAYPLTVWQWLVGDGLGILTVAPFGLLLAGRLPRERLGSPEAVAALAATGAVTLLVFGTETGPGLASGAYLVLLPLVWMAVRLRASGAAVGLFVVAQVANGYHAFGRGPFADASMVTGSADLKLFLAAVGVTVLLLACRSVESQAYRELADAREQLVAAVSHELRTPLTAIVGFSETLLLHRGDDPLVVQAAQAVNRNGRHLTELVEELLRASRLRQGVLPVHPERVRVATFLDELLGDRRGQGVTVVRVPPDLEVDVDPTHLTQVVTNLVDNALRHGRAPVELTVEVVDDHMELAVTDDGDGVDEWFVPYLFDEFAQAVDGDRRASRGLGLGLPIARAVARANSGDVVHRPGPRGACFVLRLPLRPAAVDLATTGPRRSH